MNNLTTPRSPIHEPSQVLVMTYGELRRKIEEWQQVGEATGLDATAYVWVDEVDYYVAAMGYADRNEDSTDVMRFGLLDYNSWGDAFQAAMEVATGIAIAVTNIACG